MIALHVTSVLAQAGQTEAVSQHLQLYSTSVQAGQTTPNNGG